MMIVWPNPVEKIKYILLGMILVIAIIIGRLFYLQIHLTELLTAKGTRNFLRIETVACPRGNIVDRNGIFLATNRPALDLLWQGTGNSSLTEKQKEILASLEIITQKELVSDPVQLRAIANVERRYQQSVLARDISFEQLSKIEEQWNDSPNILIQSNFKRYYPYQSYASHIIGYLGNFDFQTCGKMGLEQLLEEKLKGEQGLIVKTINSVGRHLEKKELKQSLTGQTIRVTLDIQLQSVLESVFPQEYSGTFIVMDAQDGSILGLVSRPNFDPAMFLEHIRNENWQKMQEKQPFLNRAFSACYPPGSIFKLITTSAALENNIIKPDDRWYCTGHVNFANRKYWCNKRSGHGLLTASKSLAHSCNTMFFEIGKHIDIDLLAQYAHKFGLGEPTNISFSEKRGIVPSRRWKLDTKHERWWPGETLSASIGQSFLLVTPIQVARMIASIFTGYLVKPRIVMSENIEKKPLEISLQTRDFLKDSMQLVVKEGTGKRTHIKDLEMYAKTSTAQTSAYDKRLLGSTYLEHGWFVAYFSYKNSRPMVLVILVEHAGTSRVSTDIAKQFLIQYKKCFDTHQIDLTDHEIEESVTTAYEQETIQSTSAEHVTNENQGA